MREGAAVHVESRGLGAGPNAAAGGSRPARRLGKGAGHSTRQGGRGLGRGRGLRVGQVRGGEEAEEGAGLLEGIGLSNGALQTVHCGRREGAGPGEWVEASADGVWEWVTRLLGLLWC